jgi:phosphoribosylanthranilate isomerase
MRVADAVAAAEAGADFVGIIFADSWRRLSPQEAAQITRALGAPLRAIEQSDPPPLHPGRFDTPRAWLEHGAQALDRLLERKRPLVVGVFRDQPIDEVNEIAEESGVDLVQISGADPFGDAALATRQSICVVHPPSDADAGGLAASIVPGIALAVMVDGSHGSGVVAGWDGAAQMAREFPIWLAGGLTPENVADAIKTVHPWLVDVSTGVETDGRKDAAKIVAFIDAARAAR